MRFIHRVFFRATRSQIQELKSYGMPILPEDEASDDTEPLIAFDIAEDHPNWALLGVRLQQWGKEYLFARTEFTPREIESARHLQLMAWNNGFPQPQDINEYVKVTYDLTNWCSKCSGGKIQNAPFRIKMEPKWNRRGIMTLFWVGDEFFVPPAVWETVFKPFGIRCRSVANRKGVELKTVVQLVVEEEIDIVTDQLKPLPCKACGRIRYEWNVRGPFPALRNEPTAAMAKSKQLLGHGWSIHAVIISQELYRAMIAHNVRGAEFAPVDAALQAFVA